MFLFTLIMQWNCRGYTSKFEEIKYLIREQSPACICLQKTYQRDIAQYAPRNYSAVCALQIEVPDPGNRPTRGEITLVRRGVPDYFVNVQTELEVTVIRVKSIKEYTVSNIYITTRTH